MTVVVADTSPINYLILIGEIGVLQQLYHRVVIPEEVFSELLDTGAPPEARGWATQHSVWIDPKIAGLGRCANGSGCGRGIRDRLSRVGDRCSSAD